MNLKKKTNREILDIKDMISILYDYYHNLTKANAECGYDLYNRKMMVYAKAKGEIIDEIERRINEEVVD